MAVIGTAAAAAPVYAPSAVVAEKFDLTGALSRRLADVGATANGATLRPAHVRMTVKNYQDSGRMTPDVLAQAVCWGVVAFFNGANNLADLKATKAKFVGHFIGAQLEAHKPMQGCDMDTLRTHAALICAAIKGAVKPAGENVGKGAGKAKAKAKAEEQGEGQGERGVVALALSDEALAARCARAEARVLELEREAEKATALDAALSAAQMRIMQLEAALSEALAVALAPAVEPVEVVVPAPLKRAKKAA